MHKFVHCLDNSCGMSCFNPIRQGMKVGVHVPCMASVTEFSYKSEQESQIPLGLGRKRANALEIRIKDLI
jgi:hypothetical protein